MARCLRRRARLELGRHPRVLSARLSNSASEKPYEGDP